MTLARLSPALLLVTLSLAGCFGEGESVEPPAANGTTNGTTGGGNGTSPAIMWKNPAADGSATSVAGKLASFTWQIRGGSGTIQATQVCWDDTSHPSASGNLNTIYNGQCADAHRPPGTSYARDADLNRQIISPAPGTWYVRTWASVNGAAVVSDEKRWEISEPSSVTVSVPKPPPSAGGRAQVVWRVNGPEAAVTETGIAFGPKSVPDGTATGGTTAPQDGGAGYTGGKVTATPGTTRQQYVATVETGPGTYYRAYAIVNGTAYWSHEHVT